MAMSGIAASQNQLGYSSVLYTVLDMYVSLFVCTPTAWGENVSYIGQGEIQKSLIGMNGSIGIILILLTQENKSKVCDIRNCVIE